MNKLFTQLLEKRHFSDSYLHPHYEDLADPYALNDMSIAISRLQRALEDHENILIYGDYDVDGVTASTLMEQTLLLAGFAPEYLEIMLPDRFKDGYGMSERLIAHAKDHRITLVITVDCGSRNHTIIEALSAFGIDTIVTDHHECADTLPPAVAVINPKRSDFSGPAPLANLAGVGVAFKLAEALVQKQLIKSGQEKWLLDLVLLGTICDSMTFTSENRILGYYGIKVLEKTRRPGLRELLRSAGVRNISTESVGFQLGPRLNAAGRLASAELSLNLLRADSAAIAASLASELEALNARRRTEQQSATTEITKRHSGQPVPAPVIIETGPWHEGILGIVAGRLVETYHKPAFVLTETAPGILKGSGRSFGDFNLADALNYASDTIIGGGGHAAAAGVKLDKASLADFTTKINDYYRSLHLPDQSHFLEIHPDLTIDSLADFSLDLIDDLKLLEPFGPGNEDPVFCLTGADILGIRRMGTEGQHLRLDLRSRDGKTLKCVAFFAPSDWFQLDDMIRYDFLIRPTMNEYLGTRSIEARLLAVTPTA